MVRSLLIVLSLLLWASPVLASTYYVDGACGSSGTGTSLTCGVTGPFRTINEGITAMAAGDTLDIRGVHDAFDGIYHEYVGMWGTNSDGYPGKALNCSAGSPCVIQGCPASACGSDETFTISGFTTYTDWTDAGGGVWSHAIAARTEWTGDTADIPVSTTNPGLIAQGSAKTLLQYGTSITPTEGHWYSSGSTTYVNPTGSCSPNADAACKLWVPDQRALLVIDRQPSCPAGTCPASNYVSFKRMDLEGSRWNGLGIYGIGGSSVNDHLSFDFVTMRYAPRFGIQGGSTTNLSMSNITIEYIGRGVAQNTGGSFAWRFGHVNNTTISGITVKHVGSAGGDNLECPWCDAPWNSKVSSDNAFYANGNGMDVKQSDGVAITNLTCEDVSFQGLQFDVSRNSTLDGFSIKRARYGAVIREYTPDPTSGCGQDNASHYCRNRNLVVRNGIIDNAGFNDGGALVGFPVSVLSTGEFAYKLYNVAISRSARAGIQIDTADKVSIWNNTIAYGRGALGYSGAAGTAANGIEVTGTVTNLDIRNNVISNMSDGGISGINVSTATTGQSPAINYNLYNGNTNMLKWGASSYNSIATIQANTTAEDNGVSGAPQFTDTASSPPNLHIGAASAAKDVGVSLSSNFTTDYDGQTRNGIWDIGADEAGLAAPVLLGVTAP